MNKTTYILLIIWIVLAGLDIASIFTKIWAPLRIVFGVFNVAVMIGAIPLIYEDLKAKKAEKAEKAKPQPQNNKTKKTVKK